MPRLFVESWSPEYGTPVDTRDQPPTPDQTAEQVELNVEREPSAWTPLQPEAAVLETVDTVLFVDGVRRVDARLTLEDPELGPVPGVCASFAAGAARWRRGQRATIDRVQVERRAIFARGQKAEIPEIGAGDPIGAVDLGARGNSGVGARLRYIGEAVPTDDPAALVSLLQTRMRQYEGELSRELARAGELVIADGPIHPLEPLPLVGFVKSQRVAYLPPALSPVLAALSPGTRTPLFVFDKQRFPRYSWYIRLASPNGAPVSHAWAGVARCECTAAMPKEDARLLADQAARLLPRFASSEHIDPRAPQNLVPVGALERELRRLLGDPALVYRALRASLHGLPVGDA